MENGMVAQLPFAFNPGLLTAESLLERKLRLI